MVTLNIFEAWVCSYFQEFSDLFQGCNLEDLWSEHKPEINKGFL
jgi:hypothetical protein